VVVAVRGGRRPLRSPSLVVAVSGGRYLWWSPSAAIAVRCDRCPWWSPSTVIDFRGDRLLRWSIRVWRERTAESGPVTLATIVGGERDRTAPQTAVRCRSEGSSCAVGPAARARRRTRSGWRGRWFRPATGFSIAFHTVGSTPAPGLRRRRASPSGRWSRSCRPAGRVLDL